MYLGDDGAKELVIICVMFISPVRMNGLKTASSPLKGWSHGKTHVTLIQEINSQCDVSLSINCLCVTLRKAKRQSSAKKKYC